MGEKLGFSISQKFDGTMDAFMAHGIRYLEVRLVKGSDRELMQSYIDTALREKKRLGFEIYTLHLPQLVDYDFSALDEQVRLAAIEKQKEIVEMALCLEPKVLVVHPDTGQTDAENWHLRHAALKKSMAEFAPWCKQKGLKIALENLTQKSAFQSAEVLVDVIESLKADNIGICFDVNHLFVQSHREFIEKARKYLLTMHISDNDGVAERHFIPGDGVLDWKEILASLDEIGYDATLIFECGPNVLNTEILSDGVQVLMDKWNALKV